MYRNGYENDYMYDWVIKKNGGKVPEDDTMKKAPQRQSTQENDK